jgi:hypothetical protein
MSPVAAAVTRKPAHQIDVTNRRRKTPNQQQLM